MKGSLFIFPMLIFTLLFSQGCSTTGKSVGTGATIGGVAGATAGALADPGDNGQNRFRNVVIGTAIGGALGAGAGFMFERTAKDNRQEAYENGKHDGKKEIESPSVSASGNQPRLIQAKTEARWVPDQSRGNTFVPGHFEYVIIESAHWEKGQ